MQNSFTRFVIHHPSNRYALKTTGLRDYVLPRTQDEAIGNLCTAATELCSQTKWLLTDTNDDDSDSDSDFSVSGNDTATNKLQELVQSIKIYTNCLIDLSTALSCPALEPEHDDKPSLVRLEQRSGHDYHTDLVRNKFPQAEVRLQQSLGKISWDRYLRMQQERTSNVHGHPTLTSGDKSRAADSEFQDSGLGTSLPQLASTYAPTILSFMTSISGGKGVRIPPLSVEAKKGIPFECNACGKYIRSTNNREWR
jgi:hypothetical protein